MHFLNLVCYTPQATHSFYLSYVFEENFCSNIAKFFLKIKIKYFINSYRKGCLGVEFVNITSQNLLVCKRANNLSSFVALSHWLRS